MQKCICGAMPRRKSEMCAVQWKIATHSHVFTIRKLHVCSVLTMCVQCNVSVAILVVVADADALTLLQYLNQNMLQHCEESNSMKTYNWPCDRVVSFQRMLFDVGARKCQIAHTTGSLTPTEHHSKWQCVRWMYCVAIFSIIVNDDSNNILS